MDLKPTRPRLIAALVFSLGAALIIAYWLGFFGGSEAFEFYDIDYYRNAVLDVMSGTKSMYDALGYPPFAFLLIWWLPGLPILLGNQVWTAATMLIVVALALALGRAAAEVAAQRENRMWLYTWVSGSVALLLLTIPLYSQLTAGQLSIVVIALAFVDAIGAERIPRRFQGVLVGIAGAIKVTPLIFVIYFLVTGQRRQAAVATGSFAVATALAWVIFPEGSLFFWTHVGKNDQFGDPARLDNLSIHSALARFSAALGESTLLWMALGAVVVAASMWQARRHFLRGEVVEAVLVVGASATVVAPIAWPHYFTWLPLAALWLIMTGNRRAKRIGVGISFCYSLLALPLLLGSKVGGNAVISLGVSTLLVLIPVLIGLLGLPRREPPADRLDPGADERSPVRESPVS